MTEDRAVVPTQQAGVISFGQQNLSGDQLIPPRVKIVQHMSAERANGSAEPGEFWNTLTNENLGNTIKFVPILTFMNRVFMVRDQRRAVADEILVAANFEPLSEGDGLKCRSLDMVVGNGEPGIHCAECPLSKWHGVGNQEPPPCSEVYAVASVTEHGDLIILQFLRSSAKAGRQFFSMLRFAGVDSAPWERLYSITTHEETIKKKGSFFVPVINRVPNEEVAPELKVQAYRWAQMLGAQGPIDVTPPDDDEEEATGSAPTGDKKDGDPF